MRKVLRIVIRRVVNAGITILGILCLNYLLIRLMPGNPEASLTPHNPQYAGLAADNIRLFGLDKPAWQQFVIYIQNTFTLNWGVSYYWKQPVADLLTHDLVWTLLLVGTSTILTTILGMVVGSYAAVKRGKPFDLLSTGIGIFFYGMPIFWLAIVLRLIFERNSFVGQYFSWWPVFPGGGYWDDPNTGFPQQWAWDWLHVSNVIYHLFLPALTLSLGTLAGISLVMRSSLIDVMTEDFVLTAKAKGLSDRQVLRRHIFPSGLPPMVSLIALDIAFIVGGAYQVEYIFNYKGIGWRTIQAIEVLDFPVLQFIIVIGGVAIVLANLFSDFILLWLDPRIKIS
jgi:peptide/nickel transport system permease protein